MKSSKIIFRLETKDKELLETTARLNKISLSNLVRNICKDYIDFVKGLDKLEADQEVVLDETNN